MKLHDTPLGKQSPYIDQYAPHLLCPIPRKHKRDEIGVLTPLPFFGFDCWNAYEISWLNKKGKPVIATATIIFPIDNIFLIESKSLKLYFNSLNQTRFENEQAVLDCIQKDLSEATQSTVIVQLNDHAMHHITQLKSDCLDDQDIAIEHYTPNPTLLKTENNTIVTEALHSHLLKSNCLVTGQPDWGSIEITYTGQKIDRAQLLRYLIGFRQHHEFHEQCVERIFMDIRAYCALTELTVYARYTRRGGLDINPYRSTSAVFHVKNNRLYRQ